MQYKRIKLSALLFFGLGFTGLQAQTSINSTGGKTSGSDGSVSYSVGQAFYQNNTGTNGSVAEGVQQPYEIMVVTGLEEAKDISLSFTAFPNPTTDYLILSITDIVQTGHDLSLKYHLLDPNGKLLQIQKITSNQTNIEMGNLIAATYFVKVIQGNKEIKTFKIIKY